MINTKRSFAGVNMRAKIDDGFGLRCVDREEDDRPYVLLPRGECAILREILESNP
jgi:hypothetical protein